METVTDSNGITYQVVNGTAYHIDTPPEAIEILETNRQCRHGWGLTPPRLHLCFGDRETGRDWNEVYDVEGYIGRSTGSIKIPILIHNTRSLGGGAILDHCIVKIYTTRGKRVLYEHPHYHK